MAAASGRRRRARSVLSGLGLAAAVAAPLVAAAATTQPPDTMAAPAPAGAGFEVAGDVGGLYPGATTTLHARVRNRRTHAIRVSDVAVAVGDAHLDCPASLLSVGRVTDDAEVAAGGIEHLAVAVRLSRDAPDACQGLSWPLVLVATAVEIPAGHATTPATLGPFLDAPGGPVSPASGRLAVTRAPALALLVVALGSTAVGLVLLVVRAARTPAP